MAQEEPTHRRPLLTTGERLRLARERAGLSPKEFAALVGKHRNNIARWEARYGDPGLPVIRMYALACGNVTEEWLTFELGDWPPLRGAGGTPDGDPADVSCAPWDLNPEPAGSGFQLSLLTQPPDTHVDDIEQLPAAA